MRLSRIRKPGDETFRKIGKKKKKKEKIKEVLYSEVKSLKSHSFLLPVA